MSIPAICIVRNNNKLGPKQLANDMIGVSQPMKLLKENFFANFSL